MKQAARRDGGRQVARSSAGEQNNAVEANRRLETIEIA